MRENDVTIARALSTVALLLGVGTLFVVQQNYSTAASGGRDLGSAWPLGAILLVLGILGWLRVRLATYLLATVAGLLGLRVIFGAFTTPFPFSLALLILAVALVAPAGLLLRSAWTSRRAN